jgi:Transposase IS4
MMVWNSQFTCPGIIMVPHKPHPFGDEWHTICCGLSGVLFRMKLVEEKDSPPKITTKEGDEKGKTGLIFSCA